MDRLYEIVEAQGGSLLRTRLWPPAFHAPRSTLLDLSDLIADEVHITLPRAKLGLCTPPGVHSHSTGRLIDRHDRRLVHDVPVTGVERTVTDLLRSGEWTEQTDLAIRQAIRCGLTTRRRLEAELPARCRSRLDGTIDRDAM